MCVPGNIYVCPGNIYVCLDRGVPWRSENRAVPWRGKRGDKGGLEAAKRTIHRSYENKTPKRDANGIR